MATVPARAAAAREDPQEPGAGRMQLEAGAIGLTTATVWEASAMLDAGLADVLIANQVVGPARRPSWPRLASARPRDRRRR